MTDSARQEVSRRGLFKVIAARALQAIREYNALLPAGRPEQLIRPPGAQGGTAFLATCNRCGKCAEACPQGAILLQGPGEGAAVGAPYLEPARAACSYCLRCNEVCPTGALKMEAVRESRIGTAYVDQERCLAWQGGMCRVCYDKSAFPGTCMTLEGLRRPRVNPELCRGCGSCARHCIQSVPAIGILPPGVSSSN